jgi:hypothetical protein
MYAFGVHPFLLGAVKAKSGPTDLFASNEFVDGEWRKSVAGCYTKSVETSMMGSVLARNIVYNTGNDATVFQATKTWNVTRFIADALKEYQKAVLSGTPALNAPQYDIVAIHFGADDGATIYIYAFLEIDFDLEETPSSRL